MLPKERRIPRKMFPLFTHGAKVFKNNLFLLRLVSNPGQKSRFCFSISKKVAKNAVVRNRLRRAGYRVLREYLTQVKPEVLALFSYRVMPKNNDDLIKNLTLILNDSLF